MFFLLQIAFVVSIPIWPLIFIIVQADKAAKFEYLTSVEYVVWYNTFEIESDLDSTFSGDI